MSLPVKDMFYLAQESDNIEVVKSYLAEIEFYIENVVFALENRGYPDVFSDIIEDWNDE